jgi:predicted acylesterase/phospholipase RssA
MRIAAILFAFLFPFRAGAQSCPNTPTALVLSGGGAKGLAHIGVLHVLDSLAIRPDLVVGSSMGAVVGGLYASGYSAREIDSLARILPLTRLLRTYEPRVPLSLGLLQPAIVWEEESGQLVFQRAAVLESEINALLNAGFLRGNLQARGDFDSLAIPFRAVATDLLSGSPYVFAGGDLALAVRASVAIPLLFEPEFVNGRYLGDGGLSANVPITVARQEGAGRVIVSYTTERVPDSLNLQSTLVLIDHLIGNLFRQPDDSLSAFDVPIRPDVEGFQSLNFSTAAVDALIARGYGAAVEQLRVVDCLNPRPTPGARSRAPVLQSFTVAGAPGDSALLQSLLQLEPGRTIEVPELQRNLRRLGSSDRYSAVWLFPRGSRDSVAFQATADLAPGRVIAVGAVYDNDLGGRLWLGQVNRHVLGTSLELASRTFLGELEQDLFLGIRPISAREPKVTPTLEFHASRALVRRFDEGDELTPLRVHEGIGFAGLQIAWRDSWVASVGIEGRLWDAPGLQGQGAVGPRLSVLRAGRLAEPLLRVEALANSEYQRIEIEGITTLRLGQLQVRPRFRYGLGEPLPAKQQFVFGGVDGFAGRHIGELRSERELSGSLIFLHPVKGQLLLRIEPMLGAVGGKELIPDEEVLVGIRMGLNLVTGLGPIRVEYGISDGGRDAVLVRLGRWF